MARREIKKIGEKSKMKRDTIFGIILGFFGLTWVASYLDKRRRK